MVVSMAYELDPISLSISHATQRGQVPGIPLTYFLPPLDDTTNDESTHLTRSTTRMDFKVKERLLRGGPYMHS